MLAITPVHFEEGLQSLVQEVLAANRRARSFVDLVRYWAHTRNLQTGGHSWQASRGGPDYSTMFYKMAKLLLHYAEAPPPRLVVSLWTGSFVEEQDTASAYGWGYLPVGARVIGELRLLQSQMLAALNTAAAFTEQNEFVAGPAVVAAPCGTPPSYLFRSAKQPLTPVREVPTPPDTASPSMSAQVPPFPVAFPQSLGMAEWQSSRSIATTSDVEDCGPNFASESARAERRLLKSWHIGEDWVARAYCQQELTDQEQLCSAGAGGLARADWQRRFNRREQQLLIGKFTNESNSRLIIVSQEYSAWSEHFLVHGRGESDPSTPCTAELSSKSHFEKLYLQWRRSLGRPPPN